MQNWHAQTLHHFSKIFSYFSSIHDVTMAPSVA